MSFRRVTALNNKGVECLQIGRFQEAILSFRHAISCAEKAVEASTAAAATVSFCKSENDCCMRMEQGEQAESTSHMLQVMSSSLNCLETSTVIAISPHNMFEVYQGAFLLPKRLQQQYNIAAHEFASEISIVLFYNLALAHHVCGLSICGNHEEQEQQQPAQYSSRHFMEAQRFYKLAFTVLKATPDGCRLDGFALVLALLNNMAHTFSHFWKIPEAKACHAKLQSLLNCSSSQEDDSCIMDLSDDDGEFFFASTSNNALHVCNLAPAA